MVAVLSPKTLTGDAYNIDGLQKEWRVACLLNAFLFAFIKLLNE